MATQLQSDCDALVADTLDDFVLIRTNEIDEGERLRPVDPAWAQALGQMMARDGQDTPIQVCRLPGRTRWTLVAGAHRLAGAEAEGIEFLKAEIVSADRDDRRLREVRENLWRSDLTPIDRATFIAEAVAIYKRRAGIDPTRDGRAASIAVRWQKQVAEEASDTNDTMSLVYGWSTKVAEQIGLTKRSIERDLMLYRRLPASVVAELRAARHPILSNASQLRALAKLEPDERSRVVATLTGAIVNGKTITSVAQARAVGGHRVAADPADKRLSAFLGAFKRMSISERKGALTHLGTMLPVGFTLVEGELPKLAPAVPISMRRPHGDTVLAPLISMIEEYLVDHDAGWIIGRLIEDEGAEVELTNGIHWIRMAGVTANCGAGDVRLLRSWITAARREIEKDGRPA